MFSLTDAITSLHEGVEVEDEVDFTRQTPTEIMAEVNRASAQPREAR